VTLRERSRVVQSSSGQCLEDVIEIDTQGHTEHGNEQPPGALCLSSGLRVLAKFPRIERGGFDKTVRAEPASCGSAGACEKTPDPLASAADRKPTPRGSRSAVLLRARRTAIRRPRFVVAGTVIRTVRPCSQNGTPPAVVPLRCAGVAAGASAAGPSAIAASTPASATLRRVRISGLLRPRSWASRAPSRRPGRAPRP
jgi:hypothetical protein